MQKLILLLLLIEIPSFLFSQTTPVFKRQFKMTVIEKYDFREDTVRQSGILISTDYVTVKEVEFMYETKDYYMIETKSYKYKFIY
jgi:hypothetical protein